MIFDQSEYDVRCEWGEHGLERLAPASDVVIIVDVLSFSTAMDIAVGRGGVVYPYRWNDATVDDFAQSVGAEVARRQNKHGYSLSPRSLLNLPSGTRLVLPSPNGSHLSRLAGGTNTIAGCLRNCRAVAAAAMAKGRRIAVVPAGERWPDGRLRPCLEDLAGAGAIVSYLKGTRSPEAEMAVAVFQSVRATLTQSILACVSGREKVARDEQSDVVLATDLNASGCVPALCDGAYRDAAASGMRGGLI
jgi:2-phosphosulfolactate phosphatase